jgi:hypothetical protein
VARLGISLALAFAVTIDPAHWINATSIARVELGHSRAKYRALFGRPQAAGVVVGLVRVRFPNRHVEGFFRPRTDRTVAMLTWDHRDVTLDRIGPCTSFRAFRRAYGDAPPVRIGGRVVAYRLGRLVFTLDRRRLRIANVMLALPGIPATLALREPTCRLPP